MAEIIKVPAYNKNHPIATPEECPICHVTIHISNRHTSNLQKDFFEALYLCPNRRCNKFFLAYYKCNPEAQTISKFPQRFEPIKPVYDNFPDIIDRISPKFITIYKEAQEAKERDLLNIAGPGYRKAFEYLIKDYAKHKSKPEKSVEIEKMFSGKVVNDYINHSKIQEVSKRTLWLGNDETHYLKIWKDKDLADLIKLIKLTIHWIEIENLTDIIVEDMPEKPKQ